MFNRNNKNAICFSAFHVFQKTFRSRYIIFMKIVFSVTIKGEYWTKITSQSKGSILYIARTRFGSKFEADVLNVTAHIYLCICILTDTLFSHAIMTSKFFFGVKLRQKIQLNRPMLIVVWQHSRFFVSNLLRFEVVTTVLEHSFFTWLP